MAEATVRPNTPNAGGNAIQQVRQQNDVARYLIHERAINMLQPLPSFTQANPGNTNNIFNIQGIRLAGFLKRFYIEVSAVIHNGGGVNTLTMTPLGIANLISRMTFTDLSNNVRHNAPGWLFHSIASAKRERPFGCVQSMADPVSVVNALAQGRYDYGMQYGDNYAPVKFVNTTTPTRGAALAPGENGLATIVYEIPVSYNDVNLAGGMWLGVTQANPQLQITINPSPGANTANDTTDAIMSSATGAADCSITSVTVSPYQNYLDQIPVDKDGRTILPITDISTLYMIQDTTQSTGLTANNDFPVAYANARDFISTFAIFDNGGQLNAGTDVNYWAIQSANLINLQKMDPQIVALLSRNTIGTDFPPGMYYFNHRYRPISTVQFGNTELVLNAKTVNANANLRIGYEMFAAVNLVPQAASLQVS